MYPQLKKIIVGPIEKENRVYRCHIFIFFTYIILKLIENGKIRDWSER